VAGKQSADNTSENEQYVSEWFKLSGFSSTRLDKGSKQKGRRVDWKFTKQDLDVIREVKTILSDEQAGLTREQYERRRREDKQKLDRVKAALPKGQRLIMTSDYYDYVCGTTPYNEGKPLKGHAFDEFLEALRTALESDMDINQLPFHVSITIPGLYVPPGYKKTGVTQYLCQFRKKGLLR
jgi:hypothetical protein